MEMVLVVFYKNAMRVKTVRITLFLKPIYVSIQKGINKDMLFA